MRLYMHHLHHRIPTIYSRGSLRHPEGQGHNFHNNGDDDEFIPSMALYIVGEDILY